jgi:hypothetical protein
LKCLHCLLLLSFSFSLFSIQPLTKFCAAISFGLRRRNCLLVLRGNFVLCRAPLVARGGQPISRFSLPSLFAAKIFFNRSHSIVSCSLSAPSRFKKQRNGQCGTHPCHSLCYRILNRFAIRFWLACACL